MFQRRPWMMRAGEYPTSDLEYHELLARAVFSGGLGPKVVESRWPAMREAFQAFEPEAVRSFGEHEAARMLADPSVIRNRRKILAVIENAQVFTGIVAEHGGFHPWVAALVSDGGLDKASVAIAGRFRHLGPSSARLFLFSAGWRDVEDRPEEPGLEGAAGSGDIVEVQAPAAPGDAVASRGAGGRGGRKAA